MLRRRRRIVVFCALVSLGAGLAYSLLQTPMYAATSQVRLRGPESPSGVSDREWSRGAETETLVIESAPVRAAVAARLRYRPHVDAHRVGDTTVIDLTVKDRDAARAVRAADVYAATYVQVRKKQLDDDIEQAKRDVQGKLDALPPGPGADADRARLQKTLDQLDLDGVLSGTYVRVQSRAKTPGSPAQPRTLRNAVWAFVVGLVVGIAVAALVEFLDDTVKTEGELGRALRDTPVIAVIPAMASGSSGPDQVVTLRAPGSAAAEAYRKLRTTLQFLSAERPMQTLQVTSPSPMQGKTTTAANLGVVIAQAGLRVVLVCCDLRQPKLHQLFDLPNDAGFTSVLAGSVPLSAALQRVAEQPRLSVLTSGPLPLNPSELLASQRTVEVLTSLQADYDVVLLDTPPVVPVADAVVLSRRVDATLLACVVNVTTKREAARAGDALHQVEAPLVGAVLHGTPTETSEPDVTTYTRETVDRHRETA
jgi:capsular exopolysaccharide synthesis family protein